MRGRLRVFQLANIIGADAKRLADYLGKKDEIITCVMSVLSPYMYLHFKFFKKIMSDLTNIEEDALYVVWLLTMHNWKKATDRQIKEANYILWKLYKHEDTETDGYIIGGK
jgi:hypothetical protein